MVSQVRNGILRQVRIHDATDAKRFMKSDAAPALGKAFENVVPVEMQESFLSFAASRPRLMAVLAKQDTSQADVKTVEAAYAVFCEEKKKTAIMAAEAANLAPLLGMNEGEAEGFLEIYKPEQLKQLALVAQKEGFEAKDVISIDAALLTDGSYIGRELETVTVSGVHGALTKIITDEVLRSKTRVEIEEQDEGLDDLWERILKENNGDEEKAAEQYVTAAAERLSGAKRKAESEAKQSLNTKLVVELFKLFNYDRKEIGDFLEFVEHEFSLCSGKGFGDGVKHVFEEMLAEYIDERCGCVVLNERSNLFANARAWQLNSLVEAGEVGEGALMELKSTQTEPGVSDGETDESEHDVICDGLAYELGDAELSDDEEETPGEDKE
jgi:hypothetical protein